MAPKDKGGFSGENKRIMTRLKEETKECHQKLESLPYFKMLMERKLPLQCYVNQLKALSIIHSVLENELAAAKGDTRVAVVWDDQLRKLRLLEDDLAFFKPRVVSDAIPALDTALAMAEKIRIRRLEDPVTLLGYLYVFEGSTLGNSMHRPDISATFHLNQLNGCRYYASYRDQVQDRWERFTEKMNSALDDASKHDSILEAVHEAFNGLEILYNNLYPLAKTDQNAHIIRINPEAGNHPIPQDEQEINAALRASAKIWDQFPYYEKRYGERGRKFSDSDLCWLATLTGLNQGTVNKQIDWLCRVLATRGMPTIMMEYALRYLNEELCNAVPERSALYQKLLIAAEHLKQIRVNIIPDSLLQSLATEFEQSVEGEQFGIHQNLGMLLPIAVVDEKNGITGAVEALKGWLTDPDLFSNSWIKAVTKTISKTYRQIGDQDQNL